MKRMFKFYCIVWVALLVLFNVISFISVGWAGQEKYTPSFWLGYVFISLSFVGQLFCAYFAFKNDALKKTFYNISLFTTSCSGLILSFVVGGLCMLISPLPYWVGGIICSIFLIWNIISVAKASAAVNAVMGVDDKIDENTFFIRTLTADAKSLAARVVSDEVRNECEKLYEAVRYSDPMSDVALFSVENEISAEFSLLSSFVAANDLNATRESVGKLLLLLEARNGKCKLLK